MPRRRRDALYLRIDNHTDCVTLMNSVRESCRRYVDEYQAGLVRAIKSGDEKTQADCLRWRQQAQLCMDLTLARLDKIRKRFEDRMIPEEEGGGIPWGYSTDNATCYN